MAKTLKQFLLIQLCSAAAMADAQLLFNNAIKCVHDCSRDLKHDLGIEEKDGRNAAVILRQRQIFTEVSGSSGIAL